MPDDYFCPGCGNYSQKEPGNCPLCRTPLETLGEVNVNDDAVDSIENQADDLLDDDIDEGLATSRTGKKSNYQKNKFEDEVQDL